MSSQSPLIRHQVPVIDAAESNRFNRASNERFGGGSFLMTDMSFAYSEKKRHPVASFVIGHPTHPNVRLSLSTTAKADIERPGNTGRTRIWQAPVACGVFGGGRYLAGRRTARVRAERYRSAEVFDACEPERFYHSRRTFWRASESLTSLMRPFAMRGLLCPVPANRHAAPSSAVLTAIHEK
jgi:hypothetical protein